MKRGQVTLFMILGVVLVLVVVLLFSILSQFSEHSLEEQRQRAVQSATQTEALQHFISVCVEDALASGMKLLGEQGGYLFQDPYVEQYSTQYAPAYLALDEGARERKIAFLIVPRPHDEAPRYPCSEGFREMAPAFCRYPQYDGIVRFGESRLPVLEDGPFSIRSQLERSIIRYVRSCVQLEGIAREIGLGNTTFLAGEPHATVQFGAAQVSARVEYPFTITGAAGDPVTEVLLFSADVPVRFRRLHQAINDFLMREVSDVEFPAESATLAETGTQLALLAPQLTLRRIALAADDIFVINDTASRIGNESYVFWLARKNRPPVLGYVAQYQSLHDRYDALLIHGEQLALTLNASDPDEDSVRSATSGDFGTSQGSEFTSAAAGVPPGYYRQTSTAADGSLQDWQDVRILIEPQLSAGFRTANLYDDIPDNVISPEDPLILDARATNTTLDPFADYTFQWSAFGDLLQADGACVVLPGYSRCDEPLPAIATIREQNTWPLSRVAALQLDVALSYNGRGQSSSLAQDVLIAPCLPHRSSGALPPPGTDEAPYLADHTCCIGEPAQDPATWRLAQKNELACAAQPNAKLSCEGTHLLQRQQKTVSCDGIRGNTCRELPDASNVHYSDWIITNTCGFSDPQYQCAQIASECEGFAPYGLRPAQGWCYGAEGCASFCPRGLPVVDLNRNGVADQGDACGCSGSTSFACDEDADNTFEGVCQSTLGIASCTDALG